MTWIFGAPRRHLASSGARNSESRMGLMAKQSADAVADTTANIQNAPFVLPVVSKRPFCESCGV